MENSFENIRFLAIKLVIGEELETDEEKEFYEEYSTRRPTFIKNKSKD